MQTIPLSAPASAVAFSSSGAFAFVTTASSVTTFNTCNNALSTDPASNPLLINLPAPPVFLRVLPAASAPPPVVNALLTPDVNASGMDVLVALDNTGIDLIATDAIVPGFGYPPTPTPPCSQFIEQASNPTTLGPFPPQHFNFGVGTFNPISFFVDPDDSRPTWSRPTSAAFWFSISTPDRSAAAFRSRTMPYPSVRRSPRMELWLTLRPTMYFTPSEHHIRHGPAGNFLSQSYPT